MNKSILKCNLELTNEKIINKIESENQSIEKKRKKY